MFLSQEYNIWKSNQLTDYIAYKCSFFYYISCFCVYNKSERVSVIFGVGFLHMKNMPLHILKIYEGSYTYV